MSNFKTTKGYKKTINRNTLAKKHVILRDVSKSKSNKCEPAHTSKGRMAIEPVVIVFLHLFLATPGRLNDLLMNEIISVKSVTYLVSIAWLQATRSWLFDWRLEEWRDTTIPELYISNPLIKKTVL